MKPGYLTTEFWTTVLTGVISVVVLFNSNLNSDKLSALIPVASMIMVGISTAFYSHSRGAVKSASGAAAPSINYNNSGDAS